MHAHSGAPRDLCVVPDQATTPQVLPAGLSAGELFQAMPDGLLVVDPQGTMLAVNDSLVSLLGYPRTALVGRSVEMLVPVALRERHRFLREGIRRATRCWSSWRSG